MRSGAPGSRRQSGAAMGKSNRLPERWIDYVPVGQRMHGTRFIAFKVPLKKIFDTQLSLTQRFSPMDLVRNIQEQKEELGLIIDLTFTTRYYGKEDLPKTLSYSKIYTAGHEIPDPKTIRQFKSVVTQFLTENADNDKLIGVHCTHGLNRTGYLICRYLIDVEGMDPDEAIELFNGSRGHSIERQNYILDLQGKPATNVHDQDTAGPAPHRRQDHVPNGNHSHRAQDYIPNGDPSRRTGSGWHHPQSAPRFPPPWQHHQHQRPPPPPPSTFYNDQFDFGFPSHSHHHGPREDQNWRSRPWGQNAPDPRYTHFPSTGWRDVTTGHAEKRPAVPRPHVATAKVVRDVPAPWPQAAPSYRAGPSKKHKK